MLARPEPFTKAHIKLWLASQPARRRYYWPDTQKCACGLYEQAVEGQQRHRIPWTGSGPMGQLNTMAREAARLNHGRPLWGTFGKLYKLVCKSGW